MKACIVEELKDGFFGVPARQIVMLEKNNKRNKMHRFISIVHEIQL
jgi:hypothetical protein